MVVGFRTGHLNAPWSLFCKYVDLTQEGGVLTIAFWDYHAGNMNFRVNMFRPWHIPLKHLTGTQWRPNGDKVRIIQSVEEQVLRKHLTLYSRLIPNSLDSPGWPTLLPILPQSLKWWWCEPPCLPMCVLIRRDVAGRHSERDLALSIPWLSNSAISPYDRFNLECHRKLRTSLCSRLENPIKKE